MLLKGLILMLVLGSVQPLKLKAVMPPPPPGGDLPPPPPPPDGQQPGQAQPGQGGGDTQQPPPQQPPQQGDQSSYYRAPYRQGTKGGSQPERLATNTYYRRPANLPPAPIIQHAPVAYVILRPVQQQHYPYYSYQDYRYTRPYTYSSPVYSPYYRQNGATKGGQQAYFRQQDQQQQEQPDQQQQQEQQPGDAQGQQMPPPPPPPGQPDAMVFDKQGKFAKFKSSLEALLSKFTLGSSYQVISEEIMPPMQPVPFMPMGPEQNQPIDQQQQEIPNQEQEQPPNSEEQPPQGGDQPQDDGQGQRFQGSAKEAFRQQEQSDSFGSKRRHY